MSTLRVRINEGDQQQANLLWDAEWKPSEGAADWVMPALPSETQNQGGLRAVAALHTAVILLLFTDKRLPDDHPLRYLLAGADQRGWWGDGVDVREDLNETALGSWLYVFARATLTDEIIRWVEAVAIDALMPLVNQNIAVRIDAQAIAEKAFDRCDLAVQIYGRDGTKIYDQRFDDIWKQSETSPAPLPFPPYVNPVVGSHIGSRGLLNFSTDHAGNALLAAVAMGMSGGVVSPQPSGRMIFDADDPGNSLVAAIAMGLSSGGGTPPPTGQMIFDSSNAGNSLAGAI